MPTETPTAPTTCRPPIPAEALVELADRLPAGASIEGWDRCPPLVVTPAYRNPALVPGAWFDVDAVVRVVRALMGLRHTKTRRWANKPLTPEAWQTVWLIAPVFGWKYPLDHPDEQLAGTRIVRTVWIEIPRKNGKSTLSSGLGIVLLVADGELGAEVYAAAASRDQALIVQGEAGKMATRAPGLRGKVQVLASVIRVPKTNGIFRALSKVAEVAHGLNVSGAVVDEVHVHKSRDLIDAIETGTGARDQPLVIMITTSDEGEEFTVYAEKHERARKLANGIIEDPSFYGVIWAADDDADPFAEETWRACNPNLGVSVSIDYLRKEAERARTELSYFPTFCRLHLNRRMRQAARFIKLADWDASAGIVAEEQLAGREAWAGLDLSATTDLTSLELVVPDGDQLAVVSRFWLPEDGLDERVKRDQVPYDLWVKQGFLRLTEGNVIDYDTIEAEIRALMGKLKIQRLSYDRMFAGQLVQHLEDDVEVVPVNQTFLGLSPATKELERLVLQSQLRHGGHPILRWNADAVEVLRDNHDNVKPIKPDRAKTTKRVDGIHALVMAIDGWIRRPMKPKKRAVGGFS